MCPASTSLNPASVSFLLPLFVAAAELVPGTPWQARQRATKRSTVRSSADDGRMHERTFGACAPFSCSQLLVRVVCASVTADMKFIMTRPRNWCSVSSVSSQKYVCRRCAMRHVHAHDRWALPEP